MTSILGISAYYHDSAAAIIIDGKIIAAAQEERFTRIKHDSSYPFHAVEFVLKKSNLKLSEVDYIAFYEKPFLKFERLLETYVAFAPRGFKSFSMSMPLWLREKLFQTWKDRNVKVIFNFSCWEPMMCESNLYDFMIRDFPFECIKLVDYPTFKDKPNFYYDGLYNIFHYINEHLEGDIESFPKKPYRSIQLLSSEKVLQTL